MKSWTLTWSPALSWSTSPFPGVPADLIICFGARASLQSGAAISSLQSAYPKAAIVGCSTGGQFRGTTLSDTMIFALAMSFDRTRIKTHSVTTQDGCDARQTGHVLAKALRADDLAGIFVLSDGLCINGSSLVTGLSDILGSAIPITGGLAGDGADFKETYVFGPTASGKGVVTAVGFYGDAISIGHGSFGGWDIFGPRRRITKATGNVLFELDGQPALDLYERYLGPEESAQLPASGLLFPLLLRDPTNPEHEVVRTILSVDPQARSMTFAGDMNEGWSAQLMRGNFDRLSAGAGEAGRAAAAMLPGGAAPEASLLISCIGRRLLLGQRITDELEAAMARLGPQANAIGFYSYGEISPHAVSGRCDIHNQTMTVTTFSEVAA